MRRTVAIVGTTFIVTLVALASLLLFSANQANACTPPDNLTVTGPTRGTIDTEYTFTATVNPDSTTQPLTYRWTASQATSTGGMHYKNKGLTDTWAFTWIVSGTDTIRVMAEQCDQQVHAAYTFTIPIAIEEAAISGPTEGMTGTAYSFTAAVSPDTATEPITYTWSPTPAAGQRTETVTYTWGTVGENTISVNAVNDTGAAVVTNTVHVEPRRWPVAYIPTLFNTYVPPSAGKTNEEYVMRVIELTNEHRVEHGCSPLALDDRLMRAAQGHSEDMARRDFYSHFTPDGLTPGDRIAAEGYEYEAWAENISAGQPTPTDVMTAWTDSQAHNQNMLDCSYEDIGMGYYVLNPDPGEIQSRYYWVQNFGREQE